MRNVLVLSCVVLMVFGCVATKTVTQKEAAPLEPIKSLPADQLAEFNDNFDSLREDLWEQTFHHYRPGEERRFKAAEIVIEDRQLVIRTPKGAFSSGHCYSKYAFVGDFDVQMDVTPDFQSQRQVGAFGFSDKGKAATFIFFRDVGSKKIILGVRRDVIKVGSVQGRFVKRKTVTSFAGTIRAIRRADRISFLYRQTGDADWTNFYEGRYTSKNLISAFGLKNFYVGSSFNPTPNGISVVRFNNYIINAAEAIEEKGDI